MTAAREYKGHILAISLDYDGCYSAQRDDDYNKMIGRNPELVNKIIDWQRKNPYGRVVLLVGSNRQSYYYDWVNARRNANGSCFKAMLFLENYLRQQGVKVELDKYLLADIDNDHPPGFCFDRAIKDESPTHPDESHPNVKGHAGGEFRHDQWKFRMVYGQFQHLATRFSKAKILYELWDDRGPSSNEPILEELIHVFKRFPCLKPGNVRFDAIHHAPASRWRPTPIGHCDFSEEANDIHYAHHTKLLAESKYYPESHQALAKLEAFITIRGSSNKVVKTAPSAEETSTEVATAAPKEESQEVPKAAPAKDMRRGIPGEIFCLLLNSYSTTSWISGLRSESIRGLMALSDMFKAPDAGGRRPSNVVVDAQKIEDILMQENDKGRRLRLFQGEGAPNGTDTDRVIVNLRNSIVLTAHKE